MGILKLILEAAETQSDTWSQSPTTQGAHAGHGGMITKVNNASSRGNCTNIPVLSPLSNN